MLIEKQFSSYDDYGYEDERVYSVLMDEEELRLYSEFLEEREYASVRDLKKMEQTSNRLWDKTKKMREDYLKNGGDFDSYLKQRKGVSDKAFKLGMRAAELRSTASKKAIKNEFDKNVPSSAGLMKAVSPSMR